MGELQPHLSGAPCRSVRRRALGEEVAMFLSTYVNKVDRKGRVSVPATFRASLAAQRFPRHQAVFPSYKYPALDGNGIHDRILETDRLARYRNRGTFRRAARNLAALMFASLQRLPFDTEGRVILPPDLAGTCLYHRKRCLCRPRQEFSNLGTWPFFRASGHLARARPPARDQNPAARRILQSSSKVVAQTPGNAAPADRIRARGYRPRSE